MMKIEIARLGRMSQTGSSLMTLYQDKHTPVLDLLVRESVQNCLDAGKGTSVHAEQKDFVEVNFLTGDFCPARLNGILEGSTAALDRRFPGSAARFLAVRDRYAEGLTGPLRMSDVRDYKYGNLLKLVYDICKPQEGAGAGGSWGIGKTIYFRIGIGLVVYYSRIWDESRKRFASRFAVSIVEDEHSRDAIIPRQEGASNTGIAWWGAPAGGTETEPVTDEERIREYLEIFHIEPYSGKETGTTVIVPYIDEDRLLANNRMDESDAVEFGSCHTVPTWLHSLEEYLEIAAQRWYFPRLNNPSYRFGRYLRLYVNNRRVRKSDMQPLFICWQNLYNSAVSGRPEGDTEYCGPMDIKVEKISLRKYLDDSCAGHVAFSTVGRDILGMCPPDNLYSPYVCTDTDDTDGESNRPLFAFCRMPGMVVNYRGNEAWVKGVPFSDKDKYTLAVFALNSTNMLADSDCTLEEYVRKSELADHHAWDDYNTGNGKKPDIIAKIKWHTSNKLARAFEPEAEETAKRADTGWGKVMADLILPKEGFGTRSSRRHADRPRLSYESHKGVSIALSEEDTAYFGDSMEFTYYVKSRESTRQFNLDLYIGSESRPISPKEWEEDGLKLPFEIQSVLVRLDRMDGRECQAIWRIDKDDPNVFDSLLAISNNKTAKGVVYGIHIGFEDSHTFAMSATFTMKVVTRNVKPSLKSE